MNKVHFKHVHRECAICGNNKYAVLDVHRIHEGKEYSNGNCLVLCSNCHRLHHSGNIKIISKNYSTAGWTLTYINEQNQQIIKTI